MAASAVGLTDAKIKGLKSPQSGQAEFRDIVVPGLRIRLGSSGVKTFILRKRVGGRLANVTIGRFHEVAFPLAKARRMARAYISEIEAGADPRQKAKPTEPVTSFRGVSELFMERHVAKNGLRSGPETKRIFATYVWPEWGECPFTEIRRRAVTHLLDKIEDGEAGTLGNLGGPVQADRVLAALSKLFTWYASRDEDYVSPIVRGMSRTKPRERARKRVIGMTLDGQPNDAELRLFWCIAGEAGAYGAFLQTCLLTAQRRDKVLTIRRSDVSEAGVWTIPTEEREKGNAGLLDLPKIAHDIITAQPELEGNPYVFPGKGALALPSKVAPEAVEEEQQKRKSTTFYPGDKLKRGFDAKLTKASGGKPIPQWTVHDLRHTAKTLMMRAGVSKDNSERVLGHKIAGVEGTYDHHNYRPEKAEALRKLAGLLEAILTDTPNVVPIRA